MEVYIGGRAQGKLAFVREKYPQKTKIADGKYAAQEECLRAEIIDHFHLYLGRFGAAAAAALRSAERICRENPEVIIVCDEIGCGIVPLEKSDRDYRENVGRIMCRVVERAEHVERLICGIPQRLK